MYNLDFAKTLSETNEKSTFRSVKMRFGFTCLFLSAVWAVCGFVIDLKIENEFSWFSASGAVMVSGSILFERLKPGTGLDGGLGFMSLPRVDQEIEKIDSWLMKHGGKFSFSALTMGTLIWAYGSLIV